PRRAVALPGVCAGGSGAGGGAPRGRAQRADGAGREAVDGDRADGRALRSAEGGEGSDRAAPERPAVLALIPARGGSKGIPRKNLVPLAGKPLIAWSIEQALASTHVTRTIVSTDDDEIAAVARGRGAEVPFMRPTEYAGDSATDLQVFHHALAWLRD